MSSIATGELHMDATTDAQVDTIPPTGGSSSPSTRGPLHVIITDDMKAFARRNSPLTAGHGHAAIFVPPSETRRLSVDSVLDTPGHGHGAFVLFPSAGDSSDTPAALRPSARVSRRGSLFTTVDEAQAESGDEGEDTMAKHPLSDAVPDTTVPPTMGTEEPPSAELGGQFEQPTIDHAT
ncbi:hypothetical protein C8Q77DRAFT_1065715 [Trametes polyzona]|nr:hypothetical protein C8Q77DRAFT_1065715 [Trametes polyzona]